MDELIQAMSIPDLVKFKEQYTGNESIQKIVDGYIQVKTQEQAKVKAEVDFGKAIAKLIDKLPHPEGVHNVYLRWAEVEMEDTAGEPEEVEVNGEKVLRYPTTKSFQWVAELNKGFQVSKSANSPTTTSKRALTIKKIESDSLLPVGNYRSASEACKHLNLPIGSDSATRVLQREGYLTQTYEGTDFAVTS